MSGINEYVPTEWIDHIVDPETNEVIREGTRFTANRANNIEEGIAQAYAYLKQHDHYIKRLRVQSEIDGRVSNSLGAYYDTLDETEPKRMVRQSASATLTASRSIGTTTLNVDSAAGFTASTVVTIYDGVNSEDTLITAVTDATITVQPLQKSYTKGAKVVRSSAAIGGNQMATGSFVTYSVSVSGVA